METFEKFVKVLYGIGALLFCWTAWYITIHHKWDLPHVVVVGSCAFFVLVLMLVLSFKNRRMEERLTAARRASDEMNRRIGLTKKLAHAIAMIRTTPSLSQIESVDQELMDAMRHLAGSDKAALEWIQRESDELQQAKEKMALDKGVN